MSGSPPPEPLRDPSQLAGRRRKRSDTPPTTTSQPTATTTPTVSTLPALVEHSTSRYGEQPLSARSYEEARMQLAPQPVPYLPPLTYGAVPGGPVPQYSPPGIPSAPQQVSPRTTRKAKAHVASACINCKRKHLRCDNSRPCRRCVQAGKEDTCKDVEHKKRGRPPLKPEDPTVMSRRAPGSTNLGSNPDPSRSYYGIEPRMFTQSNYPPILPNAPTGMFGHSRAGSRSSLYGGLGSHYAPPTVAPTPMNVTTTGFSYGTRPPSTPSTMSTHSGPSYLSPSAYTTTGLPRQSAPYTGYFTPVEFPPSTQASYANPIFPRESQPFVIQPELQYGSSLQLPPIRASQQGVVDPRAPQQRPPPPPPPPSNHPLTQAQFQAQPQLQSQPLRQPLPQQQQQQQQSLPPPQQQQQRSEQDQRQRRDSGERDPKRPKMDIQGILGPRHD